MLADPAIGGYEVNVLSNAASHEVNQAIEEFFAEAKQDDLVLLYFSGHGYKSDAGRLYLVTRESRQWMPDSTAVSAQFVRDQLDRCRSRRKVVILDCCYAGAFPPGATKGADQVDVLGGLSGQGWAVISASSALEYAFEDGNSSPVSDAGPSVFTGALIDGLATGDADINGDGLIDIDELYDHVYKRVKGLFPQQTPGRSSQLEGTLHVATSPRGPRPTPLPLELTQAMSSPLASTRFGVVEELVKFCQDAHPGTLMAVQAALMELAEDDSTKVSRAAGSALEAITGRLAGAAREAAKVRADMVETYVPPDAARSEAAKIIDEARREADEILTTAKRQADAMRAEAEEIRAWAQAILDHSEAQTAQAERQEAEGAPLRNRNFARVMRGWDPHEVDKFLGQLKLNPRLPVPKFPVVMRGYDKRQVADSIRQIKARRKERIEEGEEDWWTELQSSAPAVAVDEESY